MASMIQSNVGETFEVVVEIADGDQAGKGGFEKCGGFGFSGAFESGGGDFVARGTEGVRGRV